MQQNLQPHFAPVIGSCRTLDEVNSKKFNLKIEGKKGPKSSVSSASWLHYKKSLLVRRQKVIS